MWSRRVPPQRSRQAVVAGSGKMKGVLAPLIRLARAFGLKMRSRAATICGRRCRVKYSQPQSCLTRWSIPLARRWMHLFTPQLLHTECGVCTCRPQYGVEIKQASPAVAESSTSVCWRLCNCFLAAALPCLE